MSTGIHNLCENVWFEKKVKKQCMWVLKTILSYLFLTNSSLFLHGNIAKGYQKKKNEKQKKKQKQNKRLVSFTTLKEIHMVLPPMNKPRFQKNKR